MQVESLKLAHEVKNPLSLINAYIDYIQMCDTEHIYEDCCKSMKYEINKAVEILTNYVENIKNEGYKVVRINDILKNEVENYRTKIYSNINFIIDYGNSDVYITAKEKDLNILFSNILKNAIEAVAENKNEKIINICVTSLENKVVVVIKDNGIGIDESTIKMIQENKPYTNKLNGNGIGINICKNIVSTLNGKYTIESTKEGGCKVTVEVPFV